MLTLDQINYAINDSKIVDDVSFSLQRGQVGCILGPSGCGKTSLLRLIAGLASPSSGSIRLDQQEISTSADQSRSTNHPAGMVFQDLGLFPHLTIAENVSYGLNLKNGQRREKVEQILSQFKLEGYSKRYPHELSGGQQQRIALARALVVEPQILLLDEPFANLDTALRLPLAEEILSLLRQLEIITILVTHDREDALALADHIAIMHEGRVLQWDTPEKILLNPNTPQTAKLIGHHSILNGQINSSGEVISALGRQRVAKQSADLNAGQTVKVLLRCHDINISETVTQHWAKVIYRTYQADQLIYAMRLDNGERVFALANQQKPLDIGAKAYLSLVNSSAIVYP